MSPDRDKQLCEKYPELFINRNNKESREPIAWGIDCGDGWYDIVDLLCANIQHEVRNYSYDKSAEENSEFQPRVSQIKEKFGSLRFYISGGNDRIRGMIAMAESLSFRTCEGCGLPGQKRAGGWIRVLCDSCEEKRKNRKFNDNSDMGD